MTQAECLDEFRRRRNKVLDAMRTGDNREAIVQRIAMYAMMSARTSASRGGALALEFLNDAAAPLPAWTAAADGNEHYRTFYPKKHRPKSNWSA